jgi:type IV secretion system protein VirD4
MKPQDLYKTPTDPGYLGGYLWKPTVAGVLSLVFCNVVATQFVAYRFQYQPVLGSPLLRATRFALYQPFAWAVWLLKYAGHPDPRIRMTILTGPLIVVAGCMATVGIFAAINIQRTKRLSKNTEHLHGSARWANAPDVSETGLLTARQGVYVGGWYDEKNHRLNYLRDDGPAHVLAFAPTRSGKGIGLVIPTLLVWKESCVVYDIKGENWAKTAGFRAQAGQVCFKFSPVEVGNGSRFNPLAEVRIGTERDVADAQNVADMIIRTGEDSPQERYWQDAAASIGAGMVLHVCYAAAQQGKVACLADFARVFTHANMSFREALAELENFPHDPEYKLAWRTPSGDRTATHPVVAEKVREMLDKEEKDFSGVLSTAKTALALYSDPLVARNTAASDFKIDDLVNFERPVSLYLVVPPSDKIRLRPLMRLIFTQIVNRLTERMDFQDGAQKRNQHRLLFMIDEFPSLKRMEIFGDALSYMAGYGLKAYLITQDIRQIVDEYGPNESIVSNCHIRAAYAPNQYDTAELLSKMAGTKTVQKASFNYSGPRTAPIMSHVNASVEQVERPLLTPDEVMRLKPPKKKGEGSQERIVAPGDMLVFVSGHYPILGTQILYFQDPVLAERASIAPPTEFRSIAGRKLVSQPPADRTPNLVSRPEEAPDEQWESAGETSPMEEAFLAALSEGEMQAPEHHVFVDQLEQRRAAKARDTVLTEEENRDANEPNRIGRVSR